MWFLFEHYGRARVYVPQGERGVATPAPPQIYLSSYLLGSLILMAGFRRLGSIRELVATRMTDSTGRRTLDFPESFFSILSVISTDSRATWCQR